MHLAPHSPRRQKLNLRMKSLSLDSPESTEHVQRRRHHGQTATSDPHSNQSSSSRIQCMLNLCLFKKAKGKNFFISIQFQHEHLFKAQIQYLIFYTNTLIQLNGTNKKFLNKCIHPRMLFDKNTRYSLCKLCF